MPSDQSRRAVLQTATTGGLFALAGCSGFGSTESPRDSGARLGRVVYRSHHDAAHTLDVVLEYGDEVRLWERFDVDSANPDPPSSAIVFTGPTPPVRYRLLARLDEEVTASLEYSGEWSNSEGESADAPCVGIEVVVDENGGCQSTTCGTTTGRCARDGSGPGPSVRSRRHIVSPDDSSPMPELEVVLWTRDREEPVTYTVDGDLKRPGEAIEQARAAASEDGHDAVELKEVRLAERAQ